MPPPGIIDDVEAPKTILYRNRERGAQDADTIAKAFLDAYERAYAASGGPGRPGAPALTAIEAANRDTRAIEMTKLGMTVIELRCDIFFESIGRGAQRLDFARREVEIFSSALTTVLGLVGASDNLVAATGLGGGVSLSTIANYETTFFFSPEIGKVQHLVDDALDTMRRALLAPDQAPRDFESAIRALKRYQTVCTAHEIKRLVNEAVEAGKVEARYADRTIDPMAEATSIVFRQIATTLAVPSVDLRDVAMLKWLIGSPAPDTDQLDFICPNFTNADLREKVCHGALGQRATTQALADAKPKLASAIGALDLLRPGALDDTLAIWRKAEETTHASIEAARNAAASAGDANVRLKAELQAAQLASDAGTRVQAAAAPLATGTQSQPSVGVIKQD